MHKDNRTRVRNQKPRRKKKPLPWIIQIFNHQCYLTFITGCLTYQYKIQKEKRSKHALCCCSWKEKLFCPFLFFSFGLSVVMLYVWGETANEHFGFDWITFLGTGYWFYWSVVLLCLFILMTVYTSLLLLLGLLLLWEGYEFYLHWCHKVLVLLVVVGCLFLLWVLCTYWKDKWLTIGLSMQVFGPFTHLCSIPMMTILSWPVVAYLIHLEGEVKTRRYQMAHNEAKANERCNVLVKLRAIQLAVGLPYFIILVCVYMVPFGKLSPCIKEKNKLGPKPNFFGHRGAPMLGPENTMMSFEKAVEEGAFGLETDVFFSYDGVPFLMHDSNLRRTTNIREVMPTASLKYVSNFTWDFLSTLNAGKWFIASPPFYNMKKLSKADEQKARNQKIPKLRDYLELARKEKKYVIFDLHSPPPGHPYRDSFIQETVTEILNSKIEHHLVYWLSGSQRSYVKTRAPGFQQVARLIPVKTLIEENITVINVDYKRLFYKGLKDYKEANITINLYIVNSPWLYSLAWCCSINSVTTDNIQNLRKMNRPYFLMTPAFYIFWWLFLDFISVLLVAIIVYYHLWKSSKKQLHETTSTDTDPKNISLQKGKIKNQESSTLDNSYRVREKPWTIKSLRPALVESTVKDPRSNHFSLGLKKKSRIQPEPIKETVISQMHSSDGVRLPVSTENISAYSLAHNPLPTWKTTLQSALSVLKLHEQTVSSVGVSISESQSENTLTEEFSQESFTFSTTSNISSLSVKSLKF
ncbi:glycerophosphodiester phosphodiesterase domain-containing protein 4 isoform X3 [Erinaceus europaeus]|uniref:Glycerophosphodiester phosphodiesterase domain-containing protein 4 isoform X3 n=1 Tax=Erinaceus europaeus TaxID=9365 RepID=A0ABM3W805_ERIEU|nr:glycerophosphodiester phosphodiesterase domain-containing protein 4 isoform X3 [Erinaceus europaeus]